MAIELLRGHVKDLASPDKRGDADCQFGRYTIKISGDLLSSIARGDDLLLACEQHNDRYSALAVKNIDKGKMAQIDLTNNVLLLLACGFVCVFGFVVDVQAAGSSAVVQSTAMGMGIIGLIGIAIVLRRLFRITRAAALVRHADIGEKPQH
jgi:hypothetical protein